MPKTTVTIELDPEIRDTMNTVCQELGMDMETAFNIFARKVVRERRIPFDINIDPFYSNEDIDYLKHAIADLENGLSIDHDIIEID